MTKEMCNLCKIEETTIVQVSGQKVCESCHKAIREAIEEIEKIFKK